MKLGEAVYKDWKCVKPLSDKTYLTQNTKEENRVIRLHHIPENQFEVFDLLAEGMNLQDLEDHYKKQADQLGNQIQRFSYLDDKTGINPVLEYELRKIPGSHGWQMVVFKNEILPLNTFLDYHEMDEEEVIDMAADLLTGLENTLKAGGFHGHICPENTGLIKGGKFVLDDLLYSQTSKPSFSLFDAPEQEKSIQADLYAIGMLMLYVLSYDHEDEDYISNLLETSKLAPVLSKALAPKNQRYQDPWAMKQDLLALRQK